jgi:two-component system sensor histidine kinase/response regulator
VALRPKILAVDDEPTNLVIFEELLGDEYDVTMLSDGRETIDTALRLKPALVLLDIMMPVLNGFDLCRMLRAERTLKHVKVILVSANARIEERVRGYEAGADDYIVKPFSPDEFRAKVHVFLRLKTVEEVDEFQSRLLTLLGHELRTPLSEIFAPAEMLAVPGAMSDSDRRNLAGIILAGATRLLRFIDGATFLASIRSGQVSMECVATDCVPLIHQAITSAHDRLAAHGCRVEIEGPPSLIGWVHPAHLFTIFDSLLDNAIRFSRHGDSVRIRIGADPARPFVSFIDRGPGIDPDHVAALFDGLDVADIKHHSSGHGLSLVVAHRLISAMGGDLSVESRLGHGSEFRITLPLVQQSIGAVR